MTQAEARLRASIVEEVIAKLNPPKKEKTAMVEDDSRHLRSEKSVSTEKLSYGVILKTGKQLFTADETLFLFEAFCKQHSFNPHKKEDVDAISCRNSEMRSLGRLLVRMA